MWHLPLDALKSNTIAAKLLGLLMGLFHLSSPLSPFLERTGYYLCRHIWRYRYIMRSREGIQSLVSVKKKKVVGVSSPATCLCGFTWMNRSCLP